MRRTTLLLFPVVIAMVLGALPAQAAPMTLTDPKGDAVDGRASMDILSLKYEIKVVKPGNPPSMVVTMTLAAPPEPQLVSYEARGEVPGCGYVRFGYRPGSLWAESGLGDTSADLYTECGEAPDPSGSTTKLTYLRPEVKANTITFAIAMDSLAKEIRSAGKMTDLHGYTQLADPLFGEEGNATVLDVPTDKIATDKVWTF